MDKYTEYIVTVVILCGIGGCTYLLLNETEDMIPGWSDPVIIREDAVSLSLLIDDGIWIASGGIEDMGIYYSEDGRRWSSYPLPENPPGYTQYEDPQWLHRPNGDVWLVWRPAESGKWFWKCYYAQLTDTTFTASQQLNYLNKDSPSSQVEPTIMGIRYPSGKWMGVDVAGTTEYTLDVEGLPDRIAPYPESIVVLDDSGILWAVYIQTGNTFLRTSKDGITWSDHTAVPVGVSDQFFQRQNGDYVFFFIKDKRVYMIRSPDGMTWSDPSLVDFSRNSPSQITAGEADGVLWAAFIRNNDIYVTTYTDEQYQQDTERLQNYRMRNGEYALSFAILLGVGWILFRKSPYYSVVKGYVEETRWKGELTRKVKVLLFVAVVLAYCYSFSIGTLCMRWSVPAITVTAVFLVYCVLRGQKDNFFMVLALFIFTILHWIFAIAGCSSY